VPRRGDVLAGRQGAVLSGSKVLTTWRKDGKAWSATGFLPAAPGTHGECAASAPTCTYTQDVFVDKRRLVRVASRSAVTAGTVYADYRTGTITIGTNPRSHLVEQAVAPGLIRATVDDVTVANLVLEEAANQAQTGAVESREVSRSTGGGTGWRILHNDVRLNHGVGVGFSGGSTVAGNVIHHQGQLGFGAHGNGSVITNNEIAFNGAAGYSPEWEAGGSKSWMTRHETLTHNYVHDNKGAGLWADGGNIGRHTSTTRLPATGVLASSMRSVTTPSSSITRFQETAGGTKGGHGTPASRSSRPAGPSSSRSRTTS
jgi:hypothetical protein